MEGEGDEVMEGGRHGGRSRGGRIETARTHIITHLNSTIVVSKPYNCGFGTTVLADLNVTWLF